MFRAAKAFLSRFASHPAARWITPAILLWIFLEAARIRFFKLPLVPITDRDTWGYIDPALAVFTKGFFEQSHRGFPYPGFIYLILRQWQDFSWIVIVHGIIALLGGGFLWLAWRKLARLLPARRDLQITHQVLGLLMLAAYLFAMRQIIIEHTIRPEAIFPAFSALQLWLTLSFIEQAFVAKGRAAMFVSGVLMAFNATVLYMLKPEYGFALGFSMLPLAAAIFMVKGGRRWLAPAALAVAGVAALLLFHLPEKRLNEKFRPDESPFLAMLLFSVHAKLIYPELVREPSQGPYDRTFIANLAKEVEFALSNPPNRGADPYPSLGFDPDYIMYRSPVIKMIEKQGGNAKGAGEFCYYYYGMAWKHDPLGMIRKIGRELGLFYRFRGRVTDMLGKNYPIQPRYRESLDLLENTGHITAELGRWPVLTNYVESVRKLTNDRRVVRQKLGATLLLKTVDGTFFVALLGLVALAVASKMSPRFKAAAAAFPVSPFAVGFMLAAFNLGMSLTTAVAHSMKVGRFTQVQFAFTIFSYFATLLIIAAVLLEYFKPAKDTPMVQPPAGGQ